MFIRIGEYTINTDNIAFASENSNGLTTIFFVGTDNNVQIYKDESESLWKLLNREEIKSETE